MCGVGFDGALTPDDEIAAKFAECADVREGCPSTHQEGRRGTALEEGKELLVHGVGNRRPAWPSLGVKKLLLLIPDERVP
jgi:hypothetical protein